MKRGTELMCKADHLAKAFAHRRGDILLHQSKRNEPLCGRTDGAFLEAQALVLQQENKMLWFLDRVG